MRTNLSAFWQRGLNSLHPTNQTVGLQTAKGMAQTAARRRGDFWACRWPRWPLGSYSDVVLNGCCLAEWVSGVVEDGAFASTENLPTSPTHWF